ncbi:MAG TPA: GtrA family protein [Candidatus Paceibacterota bacterium]|nr:GtrA family protein [Candidatus Paceibacterota bacterium]
MNRKDWTAILIIGGGVGLLIQPILANNIPAQYLPYLTAPARIGIFVFFLLFAPLALAIARAVSRWIKSLYQFAEFAAVGTLNSFIDVGVLNLETFFYGGVVGTALFAAFKAVSFLCATTNSFLWNKYWTFNSTEKATAGQVGGFYSIAIVGWVLNVGAATFVKAIGPADSHVWVNIVAPVAGIAVSFAWNFIGYKYWVFKKKETLPAA